jgi:hypothetical protein
MPQPDEPGDGNPHVKSHESGQPDFYLENGLLVFTAAHHLNRGSCCGSCCRHCPYDPPHVEGNRKVH